MHASNLAHSFLKYVNPVWPLCMLLIVVAFACLPSLQYELRLQWNAIEQYQWWRLITAHWVHLGWQHALLNGLGLLLIWYLRPSGEWFWWWAFYLLTSLLISGVLLYQAHVSNYVGASGVLHGMLILAAYYSGILSAPRRILFISIIVIKLIWEQTHWYSDDGLDQLIGGYVVTDAHLWGGISGVMVLCLIKLKKVLSS